MKRLVVLLLILGALMSLFPATSFAEIVGAPVKGQTFYPAYIPPFTNNGNYHVVLEINDGAKTYKMFHSFVAPLNLATYKGSGFGLENKWVLSAMGLGQDDTNFPEVSYNPYTASNLPEGSAKNGWSIVGILNAAPSDQTLQLNTIPETGGYTKIVYANFDIKTAEGDTFWVASKIPDQGVDHRSGVARQKDVEAWYPLQSSAVELESLRKVVPNPGTYKLFLNVHKPGTPPVADEDEQQILVSEYGFGIVIERNANGVDQEWLVPTVQNQTVLRFSLGSGLSNTVDVQETYNLNLGANKPHTIYSVREPNERITVIEPSESYPDAGAGSGSQPSNPQEPQKPSAPDSNWDVIGWVKYIADWIIYVFSVVGWVFSKIGTTIGSIFSSSSGFIKMITSFFSFLPPEVVTVMAAGMSVAVILRIFGR